MERDDLHREVYRTQGKLTSCFGYDAMDRKTWQFASNLQMDKLSGVHNPGINTSLLVEHAYNPIHRRYQYDPAGELTRTLDKLRGEIKYEYEANGQLHSRDTGQLVDSEEFRYDAAANRLNFNTSQFDHVKDNRIKQWRDQEYSYDPWGNLIEKRIGLTTLQTFSYDCENRLVKAETLVNSKLESIGTYRYDGLGRRIGKTSIKDGKTEHKNFLWQGLRMLREESPQQSSLYIYEPGSYAPLARVDQSEGEEQKLYYFHIDQIGTPLEMTDVEGQIVWQATYKAWGSIETLAVNEVEQNLRFQGQYFDDETGLHYNTFRYYDPQVGRFITQDPISILGGANLYQYAVNPLGWLDPLGWAGNPANATHITYEGIKNGKPYIGYASKPGLGHAAQDVLEYIYSSTAHFDYDPVPIFVGDGQSGKDTARGLEQRIFEDKNGLEGTSNKQNPVGKNNPNRDRYLAAADENRAGGAKSSGTKGVAC
ncbi:RHS repeat-associated core domain-containing protein [Pseudomonas agarici]|nr:RHS repeat-associated core domain-containing protein [Pseudomonas agarici]